jgi:hypothetical protein
MSGITSVVDPIFSGVSDAFGDAASSGAGSLGSSLIKSALTDSQLSDEQSAREQQAAANAAAKENELTDSANQQIDQRNLNLQKGLSHAKAFFAAQGIDPNSGSAAALADADTANTGALNDYTETQLGNSISDLNRGVSDLQSNDLLSRTQKEQQQFLNSFLD